MATETARCPRLLDQIRDRGRVKHFSLCTEQAYVHWIRRFIVFLIRATFREWYPESSKFRQEL